MLKKTTLSFRFNVFCDTVCLNNISLYQPILTICLPLKEEYHKREKTSWILQNFASDRNGKQYFT